MASNKEHDEDDDDDDKQRNSTTKIVQPRPYLVFPFAINISTNF